MITKAPGNGFPYAQLLASNTIAAPHFVAGLKTFTGQYLYDSQCPMIKVYNICSHTLPAAEDCGKIPNFFLWFSMKFRKANFTKLCNTNVFFF